MICGLIDKGPSAPLAAVGVIVLAISSVFSAFCPAQTAEYSADSANAEPEQNSRRGLQLVRASNLRNQGWPPPHEECTPAQSQQSTNGAECRVIERHGNYGKDGHDWNR